jgi:hypothetical protein
MTSKRYLRIGLAVGFVVLSAVLLWMLTSPPQPRVREGVDDTLVRQDKLETQIKEQRGKIAEQEETIKKLKKDFDDSKSRISDGEKQANAAIGNMQLAI